MPIRVCKAKFKGVHWIKPRSLWGAHIHVNYKSIHLGTFSDETEAAKAYDTAARQYFGDFARTNFAA